jgi:hypothetical protein
VTALGFVAEATLEVSAPPGQLFDRLADHASWGSWMPRSFRPIGRTLGELRPGDKPRVAIAGVPGTTTLKVTVVDRPREITWTGGVRGLLHAEHRFLFEPTPTGTRLRSLETWSGALAPIVRAFVRPAAERAARAQLGSLAEAKD